MDLNPQVQSAIAGAAVAGFFALVVGVIAYRREEKRRKEDQIRRDIEWFREKLLEAYSGCLYYLIQLGISSVKKSTGDPEVRQHFAEAQRYLVLLGAYSTEAEQAERMRECGNQLAACWNKTVDLAKQADAVCEVVATLLEQDQRIKPPDNLLKRTLHAIKDYPSRNEGQDS